MWTLEGKLALVTGAARGSGPATALALARAGARMLVLYGRSPEEANAVTATINNEG